MTAAEREVTDELLSAGGDTLEAIQILIHWFGGATGPCSDGSVWFPEAGKKARLRAFHHPDGTLQLFTGPAWDTHEGPSLTQRLQSDLASRELVGCRQVIFSALPLSGWIRWGDVFQLRPPPPSAPIAFSILDSPHPCLLEFQVQASGNHFISGMRQDRVARELICMLSLFLRMPLRPLRRERIWAKPICDHSPGIVLCDGEYWHDSLGNLPIFEELPHEQKAPAIPFHDFYSTFNGHDLSIAAPQELGALLHAARLLRGLQQVRFSRACWWHWQALDMWTTSASVAFLCLVNAIESLDKEIGGGATARFVGFLRHYLDASPAAEQVIKEFYNLRSQVVHDGVVFDQDRRLGFGLSPENHRELHLGQRLLWAVQRALVWWLRAQSTNHTTAG